MIKRLLKTLLKWWSTPRCCNQKCRRRAAIRGLCDPCYNRDYQLVKSGKSTWNFIGTSIGKPLLTRTEKVSMRLAAAPDLNLNLSKEAH